VLEANDMEQTEGHVEVTLCVPKDTEEVVANFLIDHITGGNGLVLEDDEDDEDNVIIRLYVKSRLTADSEISRIKTFLTNEQIATAQSVDGIIKSKHIKEIDWVAEYQRKFESVEIDDVVIKSHWCEKDYPGKLVITLDPKMAFGTGRHETTKLCVRAIVKTVRQGNRILDLGTGSAILAILAAKLGASEILGLDIDPGSIENALENILLNKVADRVTVVHGSMDLVVESNYYDIVVSNLIKDGIIQLFDDYIKAVKPGGLLILSGILTDQVESMCDFFSGKGCPDADITTMGEWACFVIRV